MVRLNKKASAKIFQENNKRSPPNTVDLHGLYVAEAEFYFERTVKQADREQSLRVIKADYELVRIYHPDSVVARHYPPEVSQARFQAISKAYDILRGKTSSSGEPTEATRKVDPMRWATKSRRPHFDDTASDEKWKERVITGAVLLTLVAFVAQTSWTRQQAIAEMSSHGRASGSSVKSGRGDSALAADHEDRTLHGSAVPGIEYVQLQTVMFDPKHSAVLVQLYKEQGVVNSIPRSLCIPSDDG
ncbi:hypothetical protein AZE42_08015 [Rhizopogon vesiculosus]|uniref:J domain-containing protein n=1 Tax=Rhizopogon vesiculosus TaxID=180088 RepID=A0A1J8Q2Q6_9AGAM|nr:hypothetical protein AZE42_08015 [Rhizopogon vesiculosus]